MKEIYAIIRMKQMSKTKKALEAAGFPAMTAYKVVGRGKQKGLVGEVRFQISPEVIKAAEETGGMKYVPKRMLILAVNDEDVPKVVETIIRINQTGHHGDGRIFVCPVDETIQIRTGERIVETKPN